MKIGFFACLIASLSACGDRLVDFDDGADGANAAPTVTSTLPVNEATGVALNSRLSATFSEAMDPATLDATTFAVRQGLTPVSGTVTVNGATNTATFTPAAALATSLLYTATITTGAQDSGGTALAAEHTWSFTTAPNAAPPVVTATTPLDVATGVGTNAKPTATFSKAMDPATLGATTFTLRQGATSVSGAVTVNGATNTATFTPAAALGTNLVYTATITTGARDSGGTALAAEHTWSFTTAPTATPPTVTSTLPVNGAPGVALNAAPSATFSDPMDPATLDTAAFSVTQGSTPVSGAVAYNSATNTATFTPAAALSANLVYTATITTGAKNSAGTALSANHTWSFTTAPNAAPPTVTATTPSNVATNVSINAKPTATFSKAMDPATLGTTTFTIRQGATPVSGAVSVNGATNTATFTPAAALGTGLVYTATVTTGARDLAGTGLATNHTWTFTTAACSQAPVALRSASSFVVLAGSTVTSTGPTSITGDLGVSPGTAVTGFPPGTVVGAQHAGDPTAAQGVADLTTAYNDAAGRTLCPVSVAGNLGGQTLAPGLYSSTSSLEISSGDLTLDAQGDGDAVFIFQMASTLTTTAGRQVVLANGAKAANVFWQVGTSATLGTTSAFQGTIMADQAVTLNNGATLNGRALARIAAVNLDSNTIVRPAP
jgi:hypothetical protein